MAKDLDRLRVLDRRRIELFHAIRHGHSFLAIAKCCERLQQAALAVAKKSLVRRHPFETLNSTEAWQRVEPFWLSLTSAAIIAIAHNWPSRLTFRHVLSVCSSSKLESLLEPVNIPVIYYDADYIPNPNPNGETPFEEFWQVRQAILVASQRHGETGPESDTKSPCYWLVEDQYNDDLYQIMEVYRPEGWNVRWLTDLIGELEKYDGWGISIGNIEQGHLLIYADRLMASGPTFANCQDLDAVVQAAKYAVPDRET